MLKIMLFTQPVVNSKVATYVFGISISVFVIDLLILFLYPDILKEACVDNIDDALSAFKYGANRLEYCSNLDEDGLTPLKEELISIKKLVSED